jgi:hypothetical protein
MNFKDIAKALLPKCFARRSDPPHYLYTRAGVKYDYTGCPSRRGRAMQTNKFRVGETVFIQASPRQSFPGGAYRVTKNCWRRMVTRSTRVRNNNDPYECVCTKVS